MVLIFSQLTTANLMTAVSGPNEPELRRAFLPLQEPFATVVAALGKSPLFNNKVPCGRISDRIKRVQKLGEFGHFITHVKRKTLFSTILITRKMNQE